MPTTSVLEMLLYFGLDPDETGDSGTSALHQIVKDGRPDLVEVLLERGADATLEDRAGRTPLDYVGPDNPIRGTMAHIKLREATRGGEWSEWDECGDCKGEDDD